MRFQQMRYPDGVEAFGINQMGNEIYDFEFDLRVGQPDRDYQPEIVIFMGHNQLRMLYDICITDCQAPKEDEKRNIEWLGHKIVRVAEQNYFAMGLVE